jgi:hypothetical protein
MKHASSSPLLAPSFRYLEPVAVDDWEPVTLDRSQLLSFYFCSGYSLKNGRTSLVNNDIGGVGGC